MNIAILFDMTMWRPKPIIQTKALGLAWRHGRLLASEIYRDDGTVKGVRPLGGGLNFGESWRAALVREFQEELGVTVQLIGTPMMLENIYSHHGETGHEVLFISDVTFPKDAYQQDGPIEFTEDNGTKCIHYHTKDYQHNDE